MALKLVIKENWRDIEIFILVDVLKQNFISKMYSFAKYFNCLQPLYRSRLNHKSNYLEKEILYPEFQ